jgi:ATP-dependent helicase HrpA
MLPEVMAADRLMAQKEIRRLTRAKGKLRSKTDFEKKIDRLQKRLEGSRRKRDSRRQNRPEIRFNEDLPIFDKRDEIIDGIRRHPVVVVSGETGSGKTTQLPKFCLAAGRGIDGVIGCTQPRRIAATTVARRIAEELGEETGRAVGYKIRFKERTARETYIKIMTDGILLAETQGDPLLSAYDTLIVDEAHERSLNIDFILGFLKTLQRRRNDLKLIITSATIDTAKFSRAFGNAPVIEVSGRMFPVETEYTEPDENQTANGELTHVDLAVRAAERILKQTRSGDMLVFMPTEQDIRETCDLITATHPTGVRVMPLFARLTGAEQKKVFARSDNRKIIVATNVAETSITIPGIKYVIDSGLARISRYLPRTRTTSLPITPISKSSADQRKGRCGRVENGVCIRLYAEDDYEARPRYTPPEILRANLAEVILRMISLNLGDIAEFPFIDRPQINSIKDGFNLLIELGAIAQKTEDRRQTTDDRRQRTEDRGQRTEDGGRKAEDGGQRAEGRGQRAEGEEVGIRNVEAGKRGIGKGEHGQISESEGVVGNKYGNRFELTEIGRVMAMIPLDPRLSRMLIEARNQGCISEIAIIAAVLSIQDPRERPADKTRDADRVHAMFDDPESDFVTFLNIWHRYHDHWQTVKSNNQMKRYCREHFISYKRMREWRDVHAQIVAVIEEHNIWKSEVGMRKSERGKRKWEGESWKSEKGPAFARKRDDVAGRRSADKRLPKQANEKVDGKERNFEEYRRKAEVSQQIETRGTTVAGNDPISDFRIPTSKFVSVHKSILSGFLSNIAQKKEKNYYRAAKGREVMIFPGSGLFDRAGGWIVAAEVVETSRVFARSVAKIDSAWLEEIGQDLCRYTYLHPHWERNRGEVVASEQVTLFGLIIVPERKVSFGRINPKEASDIFIQSALVNADVRKPFPFMNHNQKLIGSIRDLENRFRRRDILISEPELFNFYRERLPIIYDIRKLARYLKRKGNDRFLRMRKADLLRYDPDQAAIEQFPNRLELAGQSFNCSYAFEPGENNDGVTIKIPAALAPSVPAETLDWMVPGLYAEKIEGLIKGLPKRYRKKLVPIKDTVDIICQEMPKTGGSLRTALSQFIYRRFRLDIPAAVWSDEALSDHLRMRIAITTPDGKEIRSGRDPAILSQDAHDSSVSHEFEKLRRKWEKFKLTSWDFGDLPERISEPGRLRNNWIAYPALVKDNESDKWVHLRLFQQRDKALSAHLEGVLTLYTIHFANDLKFLKRQLRLPPGTSTAADSFGGARQFERKLYRQVLHTLFSKNIRSQHDFYAYAAKTGPLVLSSGVALLERTLPVLAAYHEASRQISRLLGGCRGNPGITAVFDELIRGLQRLVPENFAELYDEDRCNHLTRYIKAIMIRGERALADFEKDQVKASEIRRFSDSLNRLLETLSPSASDDKRKAIEAYFWMLEEYKVSVFAQELKTAIPISAKRLKQKLQQIERMV